MPESQSPRLATSDRIAIAVGILAAAVAVAAVALEHAYPDASTVMRRTLLFASVAVGIGAVFYLVCDLVVQPRLPKLTSATWTADGKVSGGKIRAVVGVVVLCSLLGASYVASHWPTGFLQSEGQTPPESPQAESTGPLMSRMSHFILSCNVPPPQPSKTPLDSLWELNDYKQKLDIIGDAIGVEYTMATIRGGVRLEAEAVTEEAKQRMPLSSVGVQKLR